jgi:hypothetical protein
MEAGDCVEVQDPQRGWCLEEARGTYGVSLWRYVRKNWRAFSNFVSYKVGDGLRIRFWHNIWCGDSARKSSFPKFYSLARNKETWCQITWISPVPTPF